MYLGTHFGILTNFERKICCSSMSAPCISLSDLEYAFGNDPSCLIAELQELSRYNDLSSTCLGKHASCGFEKLI